MFNVSIKKKIKTATHVDSAFLMAGTIWKERIINELLAQEGIKVRSEIKIRMEVDTEPPVGFETDELLLLKLFSLYAKCYT